MDATSPVIFGDLLRRYRVAAGLTQEELAEKAQVSPRAISDLERGARIHPYRATVQLLADALQLGPAERSQLDAAARSPLPGPSPRSADRAEPSASVPVVAAGHRPNAPPVQLTPLIGRETEVAAVVHLLQSPSVRLVTLTGPGGIGKTSLALAIAARVFADFADGVVLARLEVVTDDNLVGPAIAQEFGLRDVADRSPWESLREYLRGRHLLLVLDNLEQVLEAAGDVADLLVGCPTVRVLATSRVPLHLAGEQEYLVPPLGFAQLTPSLSLTEATGSAAAQLFVERARSVRAGFAVSEANARGIARICAQLDGIPLAIELAASLVKALPVDAVADRLAAQLRLLARPGHPGQARQQTLQATFDWSYDLLADLERALFRRLAVFVGGFVLEAAEAVCGDAVGPIPSEQVLPLFVQLVDKSLVVLRESDADVRYHLLQPIRQYGWERLGQVGEVEELRRRHCAWYLALAEPSERVQWGGERREWMARLQAEHDNLRAALRWCLEADPTQGLRLACCLDRFWLDRGDFSEGQFWFESLLARAPAETDLVGAALWRLGNLRSHAGDTAGAQTALEASVVQLRASDQAVDLIQALVYCGAAAWSNGEGPWATALLEEAYERARGIDHPRLMGFALGNLGQVAHQQGDLARARASLTEGLALQRVVNPVRGVAWMLQALAGVARSEGDDRQAWLLARESLSLAWENRPVGTIAGGLISLGVSAQRAGDNRRAVRLLAAAAHESLSAPGPFERQEHDASLAASRAALGDVEFARAWAEGRAMPLDRAVAYALEFAAQQQGGEHGHVVDGAVEPLPGKG
jgi:predicted ATPase/transcriptional regulator with XRE-family HTH domain